jgi:hypothetical protein
MSNLIKPKGRYLRNTYLEEDANGDLILTFTPQELKILGVKEGEMVDFELINGCLHIKKATSKSNPKMTSKLKMVPLKKKRPTPKKK